MDELKKFLEALKKFAKEHGIQVVQVGGKKEESTHEFIMRIAENKRRLWEAQFQEDSIQAVEDFLKVNDSPCNTYTIKAALAGLAARDALRPVKIPAQLRAAPVEEILLGAMVLAYARHYDKEMEAIAKQVK